MAKERDESKRSAAEQEARRSASGADRMTQNADIAENALSGSTTGDSDIDYGMGEEGVRADSDGLRDQRSGGTAGGSNREKSEQHSGSKSGGLRDRRGSGQGEPKQEESQEQRSPDGGGSRDQRSGGLKGDLGKDLKTHRKRGSSH